MLSAGYFGLAAALGAKDPVQVQVEGVQGAVLDNVREALVLPRGLVRDGKVDRLWLERFVRQAQGLAEGALQPFGYYHATVTTAVEPAEEGQSLLRVRVVLGEPVRVKAVRVTLAGPGAQEAELLGRVAAFPLHPGEVLLQAVYEQAKTELVSAAQALGYLKAAFSTHEIRVAQAAYSADLDLVLATGPRYFFKDITITGAPDYPDPFLRRYLGFRPGEAFSYARLGQTQLNFTSSERFKEVLLLPEVPAGESETAVPVRVQLKQAPSRSLRNGLGYGTDTGARFSTTYRDLNLFGRGHELNANLYLSEQLQGLALGYVLPDAVNFRDSSSATLNLQNEKLDAYHSRMASLELARNHVYTPGTVRTVYLRFQQETYTTATDNLTSRLVIPGLRYSTDRFDNLMRPTRGAHFAVELRDIFQPGQPRVLIAQLLGEGSYLLPLPGPFSVQARLRTAATFSRNDEATDLPPSVRFFAGGTQTVRGYTYKSLGPADSQGKVVGGRHLLAASIEPEWAVFGPWALSVFYDAGNAFDSWKAPHLFRGAGVGFHYYSPVGALNLSLARQLGVPEPAYAVHFSVGYAF